MGAAAEAEKSQEAEKTFPEVKPAGGGLTLPSATSTKAAALPKGAARTETTKVLIDNAIDHLTRTLPTEPAAETDARIQLGLVLSKVDGKNQYARVREQWTAALEAANKVSKDFLVSTLIRISELSAEIGDVEGQKKALTQKADQIVQYGTIDQRIKFANAIAAIDPAKALQLASAATGVVEKETSVDKKDTQYSQLASAYARAQDYPSALYTLESISPKNLELFVNTSLEVAKIAASFAKTSTDTQKAQAAYEFAGCLYRLAEDKVIAATTSGIVSSTAPVVLSHEKENELLSQISRESAISKFGQHKMEIEKDAAKGDVPKDKMESFVDEARHTEDPSNLVEALVLNAQNQLNQPFGPLDLDVGELVREAYTEADRVEGDGNKVDAFLKIAALREKYFGNAPSAREVRKSAFDAAKNDVDLQLKVIKESAQFGDPDRAEELIDSVGNPEIKIALVTRLSREARDDFSVGTLNALLRKGNRAADDLAITDPIRGAKEGKLALYRAASEAGYYDAAYYKAEVVNFLNNAVKSELSYDQALKWAALADEIGDSSLAANLWSIAKGKADLNLKDFVKLRAEAGEPNKAESDVDEASQKSPYLEAQMLLDVAGGYKKAQKMEDHNRVVGRVLDLISEPGKLSSEEQREISSQIVSRFGFKEKSVAITGMLTPTKGR